MRKCKHGMSRTPEYYTWQHMHARCNNPREKEYQNYGGRGIKVCERWNDFINFYEDMGPRPAGMTLDRIDNDGNYESGNCRWASHAEQHRNTSRNRYLEHDGQRKVVKDWAKERGLSHAGLRKRLDAGWTVEDALTIPVDPSKQSEVILDEETVLFIKHKFLAGQTGPQLAKEYGITKDHVSRIIQGMYWGNVPDVCGPRPNTKKGRLRLTEQNVREIITSPDSLAVISRRYGITEKYAYRLRTGRMPRWNAIFKELKGG